MSFIDYIILAVIGILLFIAIKKSIRNSKKGCCGCCEYCEKKCGK